MKGRIDEPGPSLKRSSPPPLLAGVTGAGAAQAQPNPILYLTGSEYYTVNGQNFVRYSYDVFNKDQYPAAMFAPAPALPPCGNNANSSRTWVDFFDLAGPAPLRLLRAGQPAISAGSGSRLPEGQIPPSYVYIEINDRQTNTKYQSNLADTTL